VPLSLSIQEVQGKQLFSPYAKQVVRVVGVVTGRSRNGFFIQDPDVNPTERDDSSTGLFVFSQHAPDLGRGIGMLVSVIGEVFDFVKEENDRPTTQILLESLEVLQMSCELPEPVWLDGDTLPLDPHKLASFLNSLEGMRVGIRANAVFSAPSNPFGDYVVVPRSLKSRIRLSRYGTAVLDEKFPELWLPAFRISKIDVAPVVNVGDVLLEDVIGPLNYRADSYQIVARGPLQIERKPIPEANASIVQKTDAAGQEWCSVLTLNAFNLDQHVERPHLVDDPQRDIDDDVADQRFEMLAKVVVDQANSPLLIALQEIQDNDGAEISPVTDAHYTYQRLITAIKAAGGPLYTYVDLPPESGADGGQPGGNIRNAYMYDASRVRVVTGSVERLGQDAIAFEGSRKVLRAEFEQLSSGKRITLFNVHLASKRHQHSIFAPLEPGFDPREGQRIEQGRLIRAALDRLESEQRNYLVTGDFNDFEFSATVKAICGKTALNLMDGVPAEDRFDYNHRGKLHTLMHAIVPSVLAAEARHRFEILHGSELLGVRPGTMGGRATDHAYVLTHLAL
jgi:predicted extracellular nuclease